jgi:ketosteroid isomerase-like protein
MESSGSGGDTESAMSEGNVEAMQRWRAAVESGDYAAAEAELHPDGVEIDDRDIVESTGTDSHRVWLDRWNAAWESWRTEEQEMIPVGDDTVLMLFRMIVIGKGSGIELARNDALVARFRDEKIVKLGYYNDQEHARLDAGLSK